MFGGGCHWEGEGERREWTGDEKDQSTLYTYMKKNNETC
jgi:hypothetical protein